MDFDLIVIMPVYNEEECIVQVVRSWMNMLLQLNINFKIMVYNDGSRDKTKLVLDSFKNDKTVEVINKKNSGHGPTILLAYKKSVDNAEWIFHTDSDDEMKPDAFPVLWKNRDNYDALFGIRKNRLQNLSRKVISLFSRLTIAMLFGKGVSDVNTPYRLIRSNILKEIIEQIPDDTFAPNILISGFVSKAKYKIFELPVKHHGRATGAVSIVKWGLWSAAIKSFVQTLTFRPKLKRE